ncbi:MAG: response regulator [Melioribacteraceae bacterium]
MGNTTEVKPRLLITEDDFENQKFLQLFLKKYFMVDICNSSESFYNLMNREKYDIILMDISIKGDKNGLDLTREMRNNPDFSEIPVVCYTAHAFNKDRINALDAGCDIYLSKPSDIHTLLNALFDLLKLRGKYFLGSSPNQSFVTT